MSFKVSAPGSLMLLGEYAVLEGGMAVVLAVDQRIHVCLTPRTDSRIKIVSQLGQFESDIASLQVQAPFQFILTILKKYQSQLSLGCDLEIKAEFSDTIGFGSSAAVTVATLRALHAWLGVTCSDETLICEAREIIRVVQGIGSGADVAACVLGGVVAYRAQPFSAEKLSYDYPITVIYSGSKTKTADAIAYVKNKFSDQSEELGKIMQAIDECAQAGIVAIRAKDNVALGCAMQAQQKLMEKLHVNTPPLKTIINELNNNPYILGAKISGSGLGDCAIGLGDMNTSISLKIAAQGVHYEKV